MTKMSSVCSKQIPDSLFKDIKKSFKKAERLRKAAGFNFKRFSLRKDDIYEIEVKITPEEYEAFAAAQWKDFDLEHFDLTGREVAYFYEDRSDPLDKRFGAEKMSTDRTLREYYEHLMPYTIEENWTKECSQPELYKPPVFNIPSKTSLHILEHCLRNAFDSTLLVTGFDVKYWDGIAHFKMSYFSVNADDNKKDDFYFYGPQEGSTVFGGTPMKEIVRWSLKESKISKIYRFTEDEKGDAAFFYSDFLNENASTVLKTIYLKKDGKRR